MIGLSLEIMCLLGILVAVCLFCFFVVVGHRLRALGRE